jgi:hypothetical protein
MTVDRLANRKMSNDPDTVVERYLDEVERALRALPASQREQIVSGLAEHIAELRSASATDDASSVLAVIDQLGGPEEIAAGAGVPGERAWTARTDAWVPWLLLLGGFVAGLGWLVGVFLLWTSATWRLREKLLGTLVLPGGLVATVALLGAGVPGNTECTGSSSAPALHCTGSQGLPAAVGLPLAALLAVLPVLSALWLGHVRRQVRG